MACCARTVNLQPFAHFHWCNQRGTENLLYVQRMTTRLPMKLGGMNSTTLKTKLLETTPRNTTNLWCCSQSAQSKILQHLVVRGFVKLDEISFFLDLALGSASSRERPSIGPEHLFNKVPSDKSKRPSRNSQLRRRNLGIDSAASRVYICASIIAQTHKLL